MKYVVIVLLLASVAAVEFFHELRSEEAGFCATPQTQQEAIREMLLHHAQSHR